MNILALLALAVIHLCYVVKVSSSPDLRRERFALNNLNSNLGVTENAMNDLAESLAVSDDDLDNIAESFQKDIGQFLSLKFEEYNTIPQIVDQSSSNVSLKLRCKWIGRSFKCYQSIPIIGKICLEAEFMTNKMKMSFFIGSKKMWEKTLLPGKDLIICNPTKLAKVCVGLTEIVVTEERVKVCVGVVLKIPLKGKKKIKLGCIKKNFKSISIQRIDKILVQ